MLLAAALLGAWLAPGSQFAALETQVLDRFQQLRIALLPAPKPAPIWLIGFDEASLKELDKPAIFWLNDFAQLSLALQESGARAVAFDMVFSHPSSGSSPALAAQLQSDRELMLASMASGPVALGYLPDQPGQLGIHNHSDLEAAADSFGNLCSLSLVADPDGLYRGLRPATQDQPGLALWLVSQLGHKVLCQSGKVWVDERPVSLEDGYLRPAYRQLDLSFTPVSVVWQKIRAGQLLQEAKDRVCLIAPTATSSGDFRASIYDAFQAKRIQGGTLGVEHHLAAVDALLHQKPIRPYSVWVGALFSAAMAALGLTLGTRTPRRLVIISVLWFYALSVAVAFVFGGLWLPFWGPIVGALQGYSAGYHWRYWKVEHQRRLTLDMFSRMVAPQVVEKVLSDASLRQLGGISRRVTVLYTDINEFTPVCERHTPAEVIVLINEYFEEMVDIIFAHEGLLKQFVGDEIMAIYGAPGEQPDHAARAVSTALDMLDRLAVLRAQAGDKDGFYDIKVGINTGDVVVGHVGSEKHMEYAAVGDDVNLGARVMATAKKIGLKMLVSASTKLEAEAHLPEVEWISHGVHGFKGKTSEVELFEPRRKNRPS